MKPEQIELMTEETFEVKSQQTLPPKVLRRFATPRAPRIAITTGFILYGLALVSLVLWGTLTGSPLQYDYSPCPETTAFSIDYTSGMLSYNAVKIIDAVWNMGVGRGGQVFSAWVCYKIFGMAMLRITEQNQVTLELCSAISFRPFSLWTLPKVLRAIGSKCGWRGRMTFIWFVAAITYVLALPTILDLMTGYTATYEAMVPSPEGGLVLLDSNNFTIYAPYVDAGDNWIYGPNDIICVPGTTYQWGFSSTWITVVTTVTAVWWWGMFGLWFDAQKNSLLWRSGRRSGLYRDILDVSNALQEALGPDTCAYGNAELTKEVEKMGTVGFEAMSDGSTGYIALRHEPAGCAALRNHGVEYGGRTK
jgi:hypothetical protein